MGEALNHIYQDTKVALLIAVCKRSLRLVCFCMKRLLKIVGCLLFFLFLGNPINSIFFTLRLESIWWHRAFEDEEIEDYQEAREHLVELVRGGREGVWLTSWLSAWLVL